MRADRGVLRGAALTDGRADGGLRPTRRDWGIRAGQDGDAAGFIALVGRCWADYPGCVLDVDGEEPALRALASAFAAEGGMLWAAEDAGAVVGMVGVRPLPESWEVCRVYVHPRLHGAGLGAALMDVAEGHAATAGARVLELWSDTRFLRAHRFYAKRGYARGAWRALHDLSATEEWRFSRAVSSRPAGACR